MGWLMAAKPAPMQAKNLSLLEELEDADPASAFARGDLDVTDAEDGSYQTLVLVSPTCGRSASAIPTQRPSLVSSYERRSS